MNNGNEYFITGAVIHSQNSNNQYLHLIIGNCPKVCLNHKKWFPRVEIMFLLQVGTCHILLYNQIIKINNEIIKINNQIFKITVVWIRPRLAFITSKARLSLHHEHLLYLTRCEYKSLKIITRLGKHTCCYGQVSNNSFS